MKKDTMMILGVAAVAALLFKDQIVKALKLAPEPTPPVTNIPAQSAGSPSPSAGIKYDAGKLTVDASIPMSGLYQ